MRKPLQPEPPGPLTAKLSISLSDGSFETFVTVPLTCSVEQRHKAVERWLRLAAEGMAMGAESLTATFPTAEKSPSP